MRCTQDARNSRKGYIECARKFPLSLPDKGIFTPSLCLDWAFFISNLPVSKGFLRSWPFNALSGKGGIFISLRFLSVVST